MSPCTATILIINFNLQVNQVFSDYNFLNCLPLFLFVTLSCRSTNTVCSTKYNCPLINHRACVINDNSTKWSFICSLPSVGSVAPPLSVYVSQYYLSGLLHYTEPLRCFSGQRPRPKMPCCCCCYHDNLRKKKKTGPTWSKVSV